jgi:hypothetical protein
LFGLRKREKTLIPNFVFPGSKTASGKNVFVLEIREGFGQGTVTFHTRSRVSMIKTSDICTDDLVFRI